MIIAHLVANFIATFRAVVVPILPVVNAIGPIARELSWTVGNAGAIIDPRSIFDAGPIRRQLARAIAAIAEKIGSCPTGNAASDCAAEVPRAICRKLARSRAWFDVQKVV
jgi:hypothetical protein